MEFVPFTVSMLRSGFFQRPAGENARHLRPEATRFAQPRPHGERTSRLSTAPQFTPLTK